MVSFFLHINQHIANRAVSSCDKISLRLQLDSTHLLVDSTCDKIS